MLRDTLHKIDKKLRRVKYQNEKLVCEMAELKEQLSAVMQREAQIKEENQHLRDDLNSLKGVENDFPRVLENLRNHNAMLEGYPKALENLSNNNVLLTRYRDELDALTIKVNKAVKMSAARPEEIAVSTTEHVTGAKENESQVNSGVQNKAENAYAQADYFDFENHFRGNRVEIKQSQSQYLDYFKGCSRVLDIGCGRGEFLELLKEHSIHAVGVDLYDEYAQYCQMKGLDAVCDDCLHYLNQSETVDGIFVGQVVEHLEPDQIMELCARAYEKLEDGHYIIMETPNPTSLAIYTHAFYIDPSHVKPVHPLTLQYYMEKAGFKDIQIVYTKSSRLDTQIPQIHLQDDTETENFNKAMKVVSETLFGSQDYAIIAKR